MIKVVTKPQGLLILWWFSIFIPKGGALNSRWRIFSLRKETDLSFGHCWPLLTMAVCCQTTGICLQQECTFNLYIGFSIGKCSILSFNPGSLQVEKLKVKDDGPPRSVSATCQPNRSSSCSVVTLWTPVAVSPWGGGTANDCGENAWCRAWVGLNSLSTLLPVPAVCPLLQTRAKPLPISPPAHKNLQIPQEFLTVSLFVLQIHTALLLQVFLQCLLRGGATNSFC